MNIRSMPGWPSSAFPPTAPKGVEVLKQAFNVDPLIQKQAACISTMTYNEYGQVLKAGITPEELTVFNYTRRRRRHARGWPLCASRTSWPILLSSRR
jgi:hypothetical protein